MSDTTTRFFIDRRLNPADRSLGNRQRFIRRARAELKEALKRSVEQHGVKDGLGPKNVTISTKSIREPRFRLGRDGARDRVLPGNREFVVGDRIPRPDGGSGSGGSGEGSDGEVASTDDFTFLLTADEYLDLFFDDLELPDLVETELRRLSTTRPARAGHTSSGTSSNLDVGRTVRRSFGRRLALRRPSLDELDELRARCDALMEAPDTEARQEELDRIEAELDRLTRRWRRIPYIDPSDIRYRRFEQQPMPANNAVMFCLMDVSGSMDQFRKDLAKRFFLLLHLFLTSHYEAVDLVFIRHTHEAAEVDEETFFHSTESGGTRVSAALDEMDRIITERYPSHEWNIYAAQASDGDNPPNDTERCISMLEERLLPICQFFAYVEVARRPGIAWFATQAAPSLGRSYRPVAERHANFVSETVDVPADIYPVFRRLFTSRSRASAA